MQEADDIELLRQYAGNSSEPAFAELVRRHVNLVHAVAWRHTGNSHHAEEITQAVFIVLARKAGQLKPGTIIPGWLYQTARLTSANFVRGEIRRANREKEAHMSLTSNEPASEDWQQIAPMLDNAMGTLSEQDRNAIVLRFLENKSLGEVGRAFGIKEDTAKMRVYRALDKLRSFFKKNGVTLTAAALADALVTYSAQAAPAGITAAVMAAAGGSAAKASTLSLAKTTLHIMSATKAKLSLAAAILFLLSVNVGIVYYSFFRPRTTNPWPHSFADVREKDVPGRYKVIDPANAFCIVLYEDHTFMNKDGTTYPQYRWEVSPAGFSITWQRSTSIYTNFEAPGIYSSPKGTGFSRLEKFPPYEPSERTLPAPVGAVRLGAQAEGNGLQLLVNNGDGAVEHGNVNGEECIQIVRKPGRTHGYMYFQIAPELKSPPFTNAMVLVEFFEVATTASSSGHLLIHYDSEIDEYMKVQQLGLKGSQTWQEATFYLAVPLFANHQNSGADFRLAVSRPELAVRSVKLLKNVPIPEAKVPQTRPIASR